MRLALYWSRVAVLAVTGSLIGGCLLAVPGSAAVTPIRAAGAAVPTGGPITMTLAPALTVTAPQEAAMPAAPRYVVPPPLLVLPTGLRQVCPTPSVPGQMQCDALARTDPPGQAGLMSADEPPVTALTPAQLTGAYGLSSAAAIQGSGSVVAIVAAYNDTHAAADLAAYRKRFGLPPCTVASGCLTIRNTSGAPAPLPARAVNWAEEESLDLDMVSAICPRCSILLVEARNASAASLSAAERTAASAAGFVVNGWGSSTEFTGETRYDSDFSLPGTAITAAAGNAGYGTQWPATSPDVTAVGGTTLAVRHLRHGLFSRAAETAWSLASDDGATGAGCSVLEAKPSWQHDPGCATRTDNDVSADANPSSGAAVYDSRPSDGLPIGWQQIGGTSEAAAIIAAVYALAASAAGSTVPIPGTYPASYPYASQASLFDVTSGPDGSCTAAQEYLCAAGHGYDGPTGLGSPAGLASFTGQRAHLITLIDPGTQDYMLDLPVRLQVRGLEKQEPWEHLRYRASGLPSGLTLTPSGQLHGTPRALGSAIVTVTARSPDDPGGTGRMSFGINVVSSGAFMASYRAGTVALATGGCLSAPAAGPVSLARCGHGTAQRWQYVPGWRTWQTGKLTAGGTCLAVTAGGTTVSLVRCTAASAQQWQPLTLGELYSPVAGGCLTGAGLASGSRLWVTACDSQPDQSWQLPASEILSGVLGQCLDGSGTAGRGAPAGNGVPAGIASCKRTAGQEWAMQPDGTIRSNGKCLDVRGGSGQDGAIVQLFDCFGGINEIWVTGPDGELINANSGRCLAAALPGQGVRQQPCDGSSGEIWTVV